MGMDRRGAVIAYQENQAPGQLPPLLQPTPELAYGGVHPPERPVHLCRVVPRLMGITIDRRKLGEHELPVSLRSSKEMAGDSVVGRLVPHRHVSYGAPDLPLQTGGVPLPSQAPSDRGKDANALGD
jgi:hypothetical protein